MKQSLIIGIILLISFAASINGQNAIHTDSTNLHISLNDVIVKGSLRVTKGDTLCVTPSKQQKKMTQNGFELLRSIMLPGLQVNAIKGEISTIDGQRAIIMINGRPVEKIDLLTMRPQEVTHIEYLQNPSAEFSYDPSVGVVINIAMKIRNDGYVVGIAAQNAVTTANGENLAYGKYSVSNSEWGISINSDYASLTKRRITDYDHYLIGNNWHEITRQGHNTKLRYNETIFQVNYNHLLPNKQIFDITIKGLYYYSPQRAHKQSVYETDKQPYFQLTRPYEKYISPSINIYYKKFFSKHSAITSNLVSVYRNTDYKYDMTESLTEDFATPFFHDGYTSSGHRQTYIGEVKYFNRFSRKIGISTGARISHSYTDNEYMGKQAYTDKLHDTNIYTFAGIYGYFGKLYYYAGTGFSGHLLKQNGKSFKNWLFRPQVLLNYRTDSWLLQFSGLLSQKSPSLSRMSDTQLTLNRFETLKGEPNLKDWWNYSTQLKANYAIGTLTIQNTLTYNNAYKPVMNKVERIVENESTTFQSSFANQRRQTMFMEDITAYLTLTQSLNISVGMRYKSYQSNGIDYSHNLDSWNYNIAVDWTTDKWNAGIIWKGKDKSLSGETYSTTGVYNNAYLYYSVNQWRFGIIGQYLFSQTGFHTKDKKTTNYMIKEQDLVVPAQKNMIMLSIVWNISGGKKRKEAKIDLTNDDTDSGIFKY